MNATFLAALFTFALATMSPAQTCREVVRDSSGRIVQTIDRQKQAGGTERAVIRDASGRITCTATTPGQRWQHLADAIPRRQRPADWHGATTQPTTGASSHTTYQDASGRMAGSADTSKVAESGSRTQFRDASGRSAGSETTSGNGTMTSTHRDATGHVTANSTGTGTHQGVVRVPTPPTGAKR